MEHQRGRWRTRECNSAEVGTVKEQLGVKKMDHDGRLLGSIVSKCIAFRKFIEVK